MINKIGASPAFTSNVHVFYEPYSYTLRKNFYKNDEFNNAIKKLENNGNNDTVIISPVGPYNMKMQVEKNEDGKKYYAFARVQNSPKMIIQAYNNALDRLEEVEQSFKRWEI